jgi:hypothetical protein
VKWESKADWFEYLQLISSDGLEKDRTYCSIVHKVLFFLSSRGVKSANFWTPGSLRYAFLETPVIKPRSWRVCLSLEMNVVLCGGWIYLVSRGGVYAEETCYDEEVHGAYNRAYEFLMITI